MKITPQILQAIESAVMSAGNRNRFALKAQIAQHLVARWLDGKARNISDDNWDKIFPLISPYLSRTSSSMAVLDRLAEEMKAAAVRNAEMRWSRYIADIREVTERHFRRFDEQERERVFAEISTHPDRPPAVTVEYMARRIIEQMVPAAAAETKEATE